MTTIINNSQISFWQLILNTLKIEVLLFKEIMPKEEIMRKLIRLGNVSESLRNAVVNNKLLELDFVYGNIENDVFQPLDGQQRLTTLFLFHWYIAQNIDKLNETKKEFLKFTYETRISSREFCNELVDKGDNLGDGKTISEK